MTAKTSPMQPPGAVRAEGACMFCGTPLPDQGEGFIDHIAKSPDCRNAHRSWKSHLDEDRPGG